MKKIVLGISGGISFLIFLILLFTTNHIIGAQESQQMAERWSDQKNAAQVSCFFATDAGTTEDTILMFEHGIDSALTEASVVQESENPGARLWADAYSADGKITLTNNKASVSADAIGIGGDFFLFHPLRLLYGSYFSGNDLMQDYCVIDEDAAWQLFGSSDVAGMTVYISGIPHIVTGVIERPSGRLAESAGLESTLVYVSLETLEKLGTSYGINHYEIVMPDPVTGFAYKYVKENLGSDEKTTEVVENSARYSLVSRLKMIGQFGIRSMNGKGIIYPYWENMARGYEDILTALTLVMLIALLYPTVLLLIAFIYWWRHKGCTLRDVRLKAKDKLERLVERMREKRRSGRESGTSSCKQELE
ncbi:MAG: ABC transporter permease [Eubacterium sp.]|nr:ABC transporter permease [Eubacterium sp.]